MKKIVLSTSIASLFVLFLMISCKKTSTTSTPYSPSSTDENILQTSITQNSTDQVDLQNDDDAIANDATTAAELTPGFGVYSIGASLGYATLGLSDTLLFDSTSLPGIWLDRRPFKQRHPVIYLWYRGLRDASTGYIKKGKITIEIINGKKWTTPRGSTPGVFGIDL